VTRATFAALLFLVAQAQAQSGSASTACQAIAVEVDAINTDSLLLDCGEHFPDNLLWHLDRSDSIDGTLDRTVRRATTGRGAVIYVLDTGIRRDHQEFARADGSNVIGGINVSIFQSSQSDAMRLPTRGPDVHPRLRPTKERARSAIAQARCNDPVLAPCAANPQAVFFYSHGTAVASVAAGARTGVAPDASLVAVRVVGKEDAWVVALERVIAHAFASGTPDFRTAIVNISAAIEGNTAARPPARVEALMRRMIEGVDANGNSDPAGKRFLFVAAAGNHCGWSPIDWYPALFGTIDGVVTVDGITDENFPWSGSCGGPAVDVLAPATNMFVASISGRDHYLREPANIVSGSSYAAGYVSGMAARLLESHPHASPVELEALLKASPSRVAGKAVPILQVQPRRRAVRGQ